MVGQFVSNCLLICQQIVVCVVLHPLGYSALLLIAEKNGT